MVTWARQLAVLERQLARQEAAVRTGQVPDGLDLEIPDAPMTSDERLRATHLMQRSDELLTVLLERVRGARPSASSPYA